MHTQETLNFPLTRKIKTKRSQQSPRRLPGQLGAHHGCSPQARMACLSLRCQSEGLVGGWERCPGQPGTASFSRGERKPCELCVHSQTQTLAMASKALDDLSIRSPPFLSPLPHRGCRLPPTPVVLNHFTIRYLRPLCAITPTVRR